jgi:hypothetical protein
MGFVCNQIRLMPSCNPWDFGILQQVLRDINDCEIDTLRDGKDSRYRFADHLDDMTCVQPAVE